MIIGVSGKMHSGKDTFFGIMSSLQPEFYWQNKKFAGKLKEVASVITGFPETYWDNHEIKQQQMPGDWGMTYRDFLQRLGTECVRNVLHPNAWVNSLMSEYKKCTYFKELTSERDGNVISTTYEELDSLPNWIVTDVRFPNEAEAIRKLGYPLVRINREHTKSNHPSEVALDNYGRFDFVIENTGSLQDFNESVRNIANSVSASKLKVKSNLYEY